MSPYLPPLALVLLPALLALPQPGTGTVRYDDVSLDLDAERLDHRFLPLGPDDAPHLCLAVRLPTGERELRLHPLTARGIEPEPSWTVRILEDVLAYGFADVREEPGRELLLLTRSGAHSYSLTKPGYRDNVRRLVSTQLLYDVPDDRALPFWAYTIPAPAGDLVLLPGRQDLAIWGPAAETAGATEAAEAAYTRRALFSTRASPAPEPSSPRGRRPHGEVTIGARGSIRIEGFGDGVFLGDSQRSGTLLRDGKSYAAPALVDLDGDRDLDLVIERESHLHLHRSERGAISGEPTSIEPIPDYLTPTKQLSMKLVDIDGDGDRDLLARMQEDVDGFENAQIRILILINDGSRLLPPTPDQVLRFEAAFVDTEVVDVNGDASPDLVVREFELPSMLETVTGLEFRLTTLIFLATGDPSTPFERKPALKETQVFDENTVGEAIKNRQLRLDCDGDRIPDLVEVDLQGRIAIRRLRFESGFFTGDSWELDGNPWKRFETRGSLLSIEVRDVNGDGLGDIVSPGTRSLTVFLSSRVR